MMIRFSQLLYFGFQSGFYFFDLYHIVLQLLLERRQSLKFLLFLLTLALKSRTPNIPVFQTILQFVVVVNLFLILLLFLLQLGNHFTKIVFVSIQGYELLIFPPQNLV